MTSSTWLLPSRTREPIYADVTFRDHERRPVVPAVLRNPKDRKALVKHVGGRVAHSSAYHGVRLPLYVPRVVGYVARGAHRTVWGFAGWAFDREHRAVRMEAVRTLNLSEARAQYRQRKDRVKWRGGVFWA